MAIYRQMHIDFWTDKNVGEWTLQQKAFFLYLLTNGKTRQCGAYEFSRRYACFELNLTAEEVDAHLEFFCKTERILFNPENDEILIINWLKYNSCRSPKVAAVIDKELKDIQTREFETLIIEKCQEFGYPILTAEPKQESLSIANLYPMNSLSQPAAAQNHHQQNNQNQNQTAAASSPADETENIKLHVLPTQETPAGKNAVEKNAAEAAAGGHDPYRLYQENFGNLTAINRADLEGWVQKLNLELVCEALKRAALKQESYKYAAGIMRNWTSKKITTMVDVEADDLSFKQNRQGNSPQKKTAASRYGHKPRLESLPKGMTDPDSVAQEAQLSPEKQAELDKKLNAYLEGVSGG